jgi:hypothetical protein
MLAIEFCAGTCSLRASMCYVLAVLLVLMSAVQHNCGSVANLSHSCHALWHCHAT